MSKKRKNPRLSVDTKMLIRQRAKKELQAQKDAITEELAEFAIIALGVAAHDELGLNGEALAAFIEKFLLQFDCLVAGTVELEDLRQILLEEAAVEFNRSEVRPI